MSDMVKYRTVSFKKDHIAALYFTMSDVVHESIANSKTNLVARQKEADAINNFRLIRV
jgi:hypothetical protein